MSGNLSEHLVKNLVKENIIPAADEELYQYGFTQAAFLLLNIGTTLLIGVILNAFWESVVFLLSYIPLRSYAGGYHAESPKMCYLLSILLTTATLCGIRLIAWNNEACFLTVIGASAIILFLAPVENHNKPLRPTEKTVYKVRTRIITVALIGVTVISWVFSIPKLMACIAMSMAVLAIVLLFGLKRGNS